MYQTFKEMIDTIVPQNEHRLAYQWFNKDTLCTRTYQEFKSDMHQFLKYLEQDLPTRCHIGIVGANSYEWVLSYLSVMYSNHIIIPLDKELPSQGLTNIINIGDIDTLIVIGEYKTILDDFKNRLQIRRLLYLSTVAETLLISSELLNAGLNHDLTAATNNTKEIIFTSGTTGDSKGVMLSEAGILADTYAYGLSCNAPFYRTAYNLLPMNHVYAATADIIYTFESMGTLCINTNPRKIAFDLQFFKPDSLSTVPSIADTFMRMAQLAVKNKQLEYIIDYFGGYLDFIFCSGAAVSETLIEQYEKIGVAVLRGYGLTEASACVTSVGFDKRHENFTTIGTPLACNEVRIWDNEIQVRGRNVMIGYYKNPQATKATFDGEWLKTGDLGYMDGELFYITGRSKNVIILSNGKNIYPEEIEEYFSMIPNVDELFVFEGNLCDKKQILVAGIYSANKNEAEINQAIEQINQTLPVYKQINKILFAEKPFDKTTTKKIRRESSKKNIIYENTFHKIKDLLSQIQPFDEVKERSNLWLDLGLDAARLLEFFAQCQACYNITITSEELQSLKTIRDFVNIINIKSHYQIT